VSAESERSAFGARQWWQVAMITLGAVALYAGFRVLPTGTNLNHIDFRTGGSPGSLEMCDPSNPQFIPVVAVRSPVSMNVSVDAGSESQTGREVRGVVRLATASGKPIRPADLLVMHTRKLHLLVIDPTLGDYQHLHPEPAERDGEWRYAFTPTAAGMYRIFADFTPVATGRGLYAGAELVVSGAEGAARGSKHFPPGGQMTVARDGFVFSLGVTGGVLEAGKVADLVFTIVREGGGEVPLRPVMDAYAHLVAFDEARSGFAHLHPNEADLSKAPDATEPRLTFKITIPQKGRYVVWAQVNLGGAETFVPFPIEVQ
jgi:hypothetical protein